MHKKSSLYLHHNLTIMLKISIFLAKIKKPITPNYLKFLNKMKRVKKMKLLKQCSHYYNYNYAKEYEFSASSTPLVRFRRKNNGRFSFKKLYSDVVFFSKCLGSLEGEGKDQMYCLEIESDPVGEWTAEIDSWGDESVDERAERFIQRFYEDMREQRREFLELSYGN